MNALKEVGLSAISKHFLSKTVNYLCNALAEFD